MIDYDHAVHLLKLYEDDQRRLKRLIKFTSRIGKFNHTRIQRSQLKQNVNMINLLLSIIFYAKEARRLYFQVHAKVSLNG